jgi:hypothetical protein
MLCILWPAFCAAAILDALVSAVMDPHELRWFGGPLIGWTPVTIYSVTFLIFWAGVSSAAAMTALLSLGADEINGLGDRDAPAAGA